MTTASITFDQIAHEYDALRGHPPDVAAQIGAAIVAITGSDARVLELGVGTGRIAQPVARAGASVIGIDVARPMLRVAHSKGVDYLIQGDIQALPVRDRSCDAVLAVHVLHLVPNWRATIAEAVRVLRSGGALIQGSDWRDPQGSAGRLRSKLREIVMALQPGIRPPGVGAAIGQVLIKRGGVPEPERIAATWRVPLSPAAIIADMETRQDPETWALDEDLLAAALERLQAWAVETWGDLGRADLIERRFVLNVTRGNWQSDGQGA